MEEVNLYHDILYDFEDIIDEDDEIEDFNVDLRLPKRYIRDGENPFERFEHDEFKRRFRFTKDVVRDGLLPRVNEDLKKPDKRGLPIEPIFQLLIALRFYATSSFQAVCGDLFQVSQATVSRVVYRVSLLLARDMREIIKMPSTPGAQVENRRDFTELGATARNIGLPDIDGAIDCTHVRLVSTRFQNVHEVYRNRKGYFSLNVQAIVGANLQFLDLVPEWPGSAHDSRIFQNSRIYVRYMAREFTGFLLGDAGYPCLPFLLTPLANPTNRPEETYNYVHSRTRMAVERAFGLWKRRFPCLSRGLANKLICSTTIVVACAVLHNLALEMDQELPDEDHNENQQEEPVNVDPPRYAPGAGFAIRRGLIERLFGPH